jgi:hypothetical protein
METALDRTEALKNKAEQLKRNSSGIDSDQERQSEKVKSCCNADNFSALQQIHAWLIEYNHRIEIGSKKRAA